MTQDRENDLASGYQARRDVIISSVGETALSAIITASPGHIEKSLDNLGIISDSRRRELFPAIVSLGGQTLSFVDLVLNLERVVEDYKQTTQHIISGPMVDKRVPQYLEILTSGASEEDQALARSTWYALVKIKYGEEAAYSHQKENRNDVEPNQPGYHKVLDKRKPPKRQPRPTGKRKTREQKIRSQSRNASARSKRLDEQGGMDF